MSLYTLLSRKPDGIATAVDIEQALAGNLCRCTGYRTILNAAKTFASVTNGAENTIKGLCGAGAARLAASASPIDPGQVDMFVDGGWYAPSELKALCVAKVIAIGLRTPGSFRRTPRLWSNACLFQLRNPTAAVVAGGTAVGLQLNGWRGPKDGAGRRAAAAGTPSHMLSTALIPELHGCEVVATSTNSGAMLGGEFDESTAGDPTSSLLHVPGRKGKSTRRTVWRSVDPVYKSV